jgi:hypothetical protein
MTSVVHKNSRCQTLILGGFDPPPPPVYLNSDIEVDNQDISIEVPGDLIIVIHDEEVTIDDELATFELEAPIGVTICEED